MSPANNRVRTHFAGVAGDIFGYQYRLLGSYTRNWGSYFVPQMSRNTAFLIEVTKHVEQAWGLDFGVSLAGDFGTQFGNSIGGMITISKHGLISQW